MFLENRTDENLYYTFYGIKDKNILPPNEIVEFHCSKNFSLELSHSIPSSYHLEKFTKSPICLLRVNTTLFIEDVSEDAKLIIHKNTQPIDYIFSYVFLSSILTDGKITNEEYNIIDSQEIIKKHEKHLKQGLKHDFLIIPFAFIDIGLLIFFWKWLGFKQALLVSILSLISYFIINGIITLLFLFFQKGEKEYLNYFDKNFIKAQKRQEKTGDHSLS